ncbi:MAG TPA: DNA-binding protein [Candidatus Hydrogenedentes bacterium]|nr:DNA-binding protein [Candidatus Hydrogenedentota bacterium]
MDSTFENVMLTTKEVAALLRISRRTLFTLLDSGKLPRPCRVGRQFRWPKTTIDAWIGDGMPNVRKTNWCPGARSRTSYNRGKLS